MENTAKTKTDDDSVTSEIQEPLLQENPNRFVIFPIKHHDIWQMYKKAVSNMWTAEEIDLTSDCDDWEIRMTSDEKKYIKNILAFFAAADGIVNENIVVNFCDQIQVPEARFFYGFQIAIENIHSETYSQMINTLITDDNEKVQLFNALKTLPCVKKKADWCFKYTEPDNASFAQRLVAFAAVEGIFFSGAFCSIFWLKKRGLMTGLAIANEFISRDEALHTDFACLLYSKLINKLSREVVLDIITQAVDIEVEFVRDSLPVNLIGMNADSMEEYVKYVADRLLLSLGYEAYYNTSNPFDFMNLLSVNTKENFFERVVSTYTKAGIQMNPNVQSNENKIEFDDNIDF